MNNASEGVVMIMTTQKADQIIADGGINMARVNVKRIRDCKYIVFCQGIGDEPENPIRSAFLIATIRDVESKANSFFIGINSYTKILKRNLFPRLNRIGIAYADTMKEAGLLVGRYTFVDMDGQPIKEKLTVVYPDKTEDIEPEPKMRAGYYKSAVASPAYLKSSVFREVLAKTLGVKADQIHGNIQVVMPDGKVTIEF